MRLIDLTHDICPEMPFWSGSCGFHLKNVVDYSDCSEQVKFRVQEATLLAGIGTHIDAPSHCFPNGMSIEQFPLENLMVPTAVIDVSARAHANYKISVEDIHAYEAAFDGIPKGSLVIAYTGWSQFWNNPIQYRNEVSPGVMQFPSFSIEAAEYLLQKDIVGIAIDTLSPDIPDSSYPVHSLILGAGKYIVENVAHADRLPPVGASVLIAPMKIQGGTEAPIRMLGILST